MGGRIHSAEASNRDETLGERRRMLAVLLIRARAGDRRALDQLVERLMPLVWNVARAQGLDIE